MLHTIQHFLRSLILATALLPLAATGQDGALAPFLGPPTLQLQQIAPSDRFPNIVVTREGTLIASYGSRSVRVRRREDGSQHWGPPIVIAAQGLHGGGLTVDTVSGDILAFVEAEHPPSDLSVFRSGDDGRTWVAQPTKITPDRNGNKPSMHMNEHGISLARGVHAGRLIRAARWYAGRNAKENWPNHYTNAIFSDDRGRTWQTSAPFPENGTGEAAIVELSDGRLYYNSRVHWQERPHATRRRAAWSDDGGASWKDWRVVSVLPDGHQHRSYGCMGGLTRLPIAGRDILLFSNLDTTRAKRERLTVWASFEGGQTWPIKRLVFDGPSAYSSLTAGRRGTASEGQAFLFFEGGPKGGLTVASFNLAWVLGGTRTHDGVLPADLVGGSDTPLQSASITGAGWTPLTLEDFVNVNGTEETWTADGGAIVCTGVPLGGARSPKVYENFELVMEWKHHVHAGNSGLFLWCPESAFTDLPPGKLPRSGIEVQVLDLGYEANWLKAKGTHSDWFTSHGDVFPVGSSKMEAFYPQRDYLDPLGKAYTVGHPKSTRSFPIARRTKPAGEWNHYYVRAINGEVRLWVNGVEVNGARNCHPSKGYLALESEGSKITFRNLRIRELP